MFRTTGNRVTKEHNKRVVPEGISSFAQSLIHIFRALGPRQSVASFAWKRLGIFEREGIISNLELENKLVEFKVRLLELGAPTLEHKIGTLELGKQIL